MSNLKTFTAVTLSAGFALVGLGLAGPAYAGEEAFTVSDANEDGVLDGAEFITYVSYKANAGDETYIAIRESGGYDTAFKSMDTNADSVLDADELNPSKAEEN